MFILASGSPRRKELLQQIEASFTVKVSQAEEVTGGSLAPAEIVVENAVRKAEAVAKENPGQAVLGADTIVFLDGRVYGKPQDAAEAKEMLRCLAGREHEVATGIAWVKDGRVYTDVAGSFSNVVGLPLYAVCRLAGKAGVDLYDNHGKGSSERGTTA